MKPRLYGLRRVTISGADDAVDPRDLAHLSKKFPFVEWGILLSDKRSGNTRYPSKQWIRRLTECAPMTLSAHFCGEAMRSLIAAAAHDPTTISSDHATLLSHFDRVQLNGYCTDSAALAALIRHFPHLEFILQARDKVSVYALPQHWRVSVLFDPSGGRGLRNNVSLEEFPKGYRLGLAGGLGPDNVGEVVCFQGRDYWIDMESGVRDSRDQFDLRRVQDVLRQAAPHVRSGDAP